jgi:hypothetical protein
VRRSFWPLAVVPLAIFLHSIDWSERAPMWAFFVFGAQGFALGFVIARHVYYGRDKFR